jgi:nucleoside-diphosphate-sugar epimerase
MKVLLTGANGFVGRILTHHLLAQNHCVRAPIRQSLDFSYWQSLAPYLFRAASLQQFVRHFEPFQIGSLQGLSAEPVHMQGIDVVIHTAARAHQISNQAKQQQQYQAINCYATQQLALQAEQEGVKQFIYLSSIKVNGESTDQAFTEQDTVQPSDAYAQSKWDAEQALKKIAERGKLAVTIIRPPLVYGPGVGANFAKLLAYQQTALPFPVIRQENRRSLCYVENLSAFILRCLQDPLTYNQTFLIADQEMAISTRQLNHCLAAFYQKQWPTIFFPKMLVKVMATILHKNRLFDRLYHSLILDCQKARAMLHWQQPVSQLVGLYNTAAWYRSNQKSRR